MPGHPYPVLALVCACLAAGLASTAAARSRAVAAAEASYADAVDAVGVITTIDSGLFRTYQGKDAATWERQYREARQALVKRLDALPEEKLPSRDRFALRRMREGLGLALTENPQSSSANLPNSAGTCADATRKDLAAPQLSAALYSCFDEIGNRLEFEGHPVARDSAIAMLSQIEEPARRKALFLAFAPLWEAINGRDEVDSPYRRRIQAAAREAAKSGSPIDRAGRAVEASASEVERWLERILDAWRQVLPDRPVEPWDYRFEGSAADRLLAAAIPRESLVAINERSYRDLGADLPALGVLYDLDPRPGKAPLAYTNFVTMGRTARGAWQPTVSRISASFSGGGLYVLNMLAHETGHAVHYAAIRNRPAFMDIGDDDIFAESIADVTSWNVYDSKWLSKYVGRQVPEAAALRSRYTMVTLEVTWALFEARMLRMPTADPNAVWTDITSHYLHVVPHPELSWWAQRVQLVTTPGYMVNYGLGAVITADVRQRLRDAIGSFDTGNPRWYPWISAHLLRPGAEFDTSELLKRFLGRPASPDALIADIRRLDPRLQR